MTFRRWLQRCYWILNTQFGWDPRVMFRSLRGLPRYIRDLFHFRSTYKGRFEILPCLHDWYEEGGSTKNEYFWQDLIVARKIFEAKPKKHVDIGSRVDGFVAHVASFREVEVIDVRPITSQIPGISFIVADLMKAIAMPGAEGGYCDSLSCLHAIEHFGLGRYGDPIDPQGYERGIRNMALLLKPEGTFYLSTPIGLERVEFNANRVFDPRTIIACAESNGLQLQELTVIRAGGLVHNHGQSNPDELRELAQNHYSLGIFIFVKKNN